MLASALRVSPRRLARRSGRHPRRPAVLAGALLGLGLLATGGVPAAVVVGSIAGQPGVSASGAATYRVPIDVAAGMNGLKPDVGLVYSSQSGGWLAGAGWSLAGFSTIARCGHSIALDTRVRGVTFSAEDRFCLDGSPLVMVTSSGTYGGNNIEYRTEVHGYQKVISKSSQSGGPPDSFEVHQPSGLVYTYGFDTALGSRIATVGLSTNQTRVWALDTITDKFGNQIKFKYKIPVAGEFVPDEITWTSTGTGTGPYKLKFDYTDLTDPSDSESLPSAARSGYLWGSTWQATRRLKSIDYTLNGTRVHLYTLGYGSGSSGQSRLTSIQQCGAGGTGGDCLPVTTPSWQNGTVSFSASALPGPTATADYASAVFGDINGEGATDVYLPVTVSGTKYWKYMLAGGPDGTFEYSSLEDVWQVYGTAGGHVLDFDGNGRADFMAQGSDGNWHVRLAGTSVTQGICTSGVCNTGISVAQNPTVVPLDINGDGMSDILSSRANQQNYIYINTGATNAPTAQLTNPGLYFSLVRNLRGLTDIDGDGREDLIGRVYVGPQEYWQYTETTIYVARSYWNGSHDDLSYQLQAVFCVDCSLTNVTVADVNGDGLADLAYTYDGVWTTQLSKGNSFASAVSSGLSSAAVFADVNNDGRDDLITTCSGNRCAYLSDGTGYSSGSTPVTLGGPSPSTVAKAFFRDFNGDGMVDVLAALNTGSPNPWALYLHAGNRPDLMTGVVDGLGNSFTPTYNSLTYGFQAGFYATTGSGSPPTQRLIRGGSLAVVSSAVASTGVGTGTYTTSYTYGSGLQDMTGRGFLGFAKVTATDSRNSLVTETENSQTFPFAGRPEKVTVKKGTNLVSESDPTWTKNTVTGGADTSNNHVAGQYHFVHLIQGIDKTFEVEPAHYSTQPVITVTTDPIMWDYAHGAPTRVTVTADPEVGFTFTTETNRVFAGLTGEWCLGLPSTVAVKRSKGSTNSTRNVAYTYTSDGKCRVDTETVGTTPVKQLKTTYGYKSTGQLETRTEDSGDSSSVVDRVTTFAYANAPSFRPSSETRTTGGVSYAVGRSWNNGLGLETARTMPDGETSSWAYDDFGRLITELRPSGNSPSGATGYGLSTITRTACGTCWPTNAKYKVREARSDNSWSESYRDARGREVGVASSLNGDTVESRQAFTYNALGQRVTETVPYRSDATAYNIDHTYDLLGRPKSESRQVSEADTSTQSTTWVYNRQAVTVTDAEGHARVFGTDAEGRVESVQEPSPGGTTGYGYSPWGELTTVTDADNHETTTMVYDERGFRTGVVDLDAGSGTYEYTVWGELYRARDARTGSGNWTLTNTHDELGRLTARVDYDPVAATSALSTWGYYTTTDSATGARKGLLQWARSYAGPTTGSTLEYEEVNKYDAVAGTQVGRVQSVVTINGAPRAPYVTDYDYDTEGRLENVKHPYTVNSSTIPEFAYTYSRGYLDTVKQTQGTEYDRYDLVSLDAVGRPTHAQLGNALLDVKAEYDRVNLLVKAIKSGTPSPGTGTQNLAYMWDKVGNLTSRQDLNQSGTPTYLTESFIYDDLNRLDEASLNGNMNQSTNYDADGNLTSKTMPDNTQFTYYYNTSGKPHAVSKVERAYACDCGTCYVTDNYAYDAAGNMVQRTGPSGNRYVTWTAFSKPKEISLDVPTCTWDCTTFTYGPDRQLVKQVDSKFGTNRTIYYVGPHFEVEVSNGTTQYRSHAFANGQVVFTQVESASAWESYYPLRDHLGSVDKQYRAAGAGTNPLVYSYDSFGRRRNDNWTNDGPGSTMVASPWNHQGYTGHEMLDTARLIHMQGRVYDPTLGRFLSPDPMLGNLGSPQSLNAYSYVANNPLSATDPSGYATIPTVPDLSIDDALAGLAEIIVTTTPWSQGLPPCPAVQCGFINGDYVGVDPPTQFGNPRGVGIGGMAWDSTSTTAYSNLASSVDAWAAAVGREYLPGKQIDPAGPSDGFPPEDDVIVYGAPIDLSGALGQDGFSFGFRPLEPLTWAVMHSEFLNNVNFGFFHEHIFYKEDGELRNLGYFRGEGLRDDPYFPDNIHKYQFSPVYKGPLSTDELRAIPGFGADEYNILFNNCHDYCDFVWARQTFPP